MRDVRSFCVVLLAFTCSLRTPQQHAVECARILAVETIGGKSHWNFMSAILGALTDSGHNVTVFTPFADGDRANYTEVDISEEKAPMRDARLAEMVQRFGDPMYTVGHFATTSRQFCDKLFGKREMRNVLDRADSGDFDVVVIEPVYSECVTLVPSTLRLPLIYATALPTVGLMEWPYTGHLSNTGLVSNLMAGHGSPDTFVRRLTNTAVFVYSVFAKQYAEFVSRRAERCCKQYDRASPAVTPSLIFVNGHYVSNAQCPTPAVVVNVGGIHLRAANALPKDILEFIEKSPHGVIYFTFGSTVKMATLPKHIITSFMDALRQVPQRVLLKYEDEIENKPENVVIKKWLPQRDILLHPKVKLFISHGGISGLYEAVDAGVPVLGFPLFGDQPRNVDNLVNAGMAISMDLLSVSKEILLKNILELLEDERYTKNAKTASIMFKDRPISPTESVVYWTEYVLRHKGAPHLKSHALNLPWYQYFLLDVIASVLIVYFVTFYVLKSIYKYIARIF